MEERWGWLGIVGLAAGLLVACTAPAPSEMPATPTLPVASVMPGTPTLPVASVMPGTPTLPVASVMPGTPTLPVASVVPGTLTVPVASAVPGAAVAVEAPSQGAGDAPTATLAGHDLTTPLSEVECPVTSLEEFQACDGAFCIRAASMATGVNERHKILWLPQNGFKGKLTVQAARYGGGQVLRQVLEDTLSPPEPDYPSIWQFPTAGCWRLTATAGEVTGSVVVWVE